MVPPTPPIVMGKYRLIRPIGRGGMAEIFLAVTQGPGGFAKLAVIKRIWPDLAGDPDFVGMFLDEARLSARLDHPNVVHTFEVGQDESTGRYYIAMEYLDGQPFSHVLNRLRGSGGLPFALRLRVLCDVLSGLDYAHDLRDFDGQPLGVVHRDVSPQNVFVTYAGAVKLVDFGIAKSLGASHHTRPGVLKGRLAYMAPEQIRGGGVDRRADLFSIGVMLWEAIAGHRMWKDLSEGAIARALISGEAMPPPPANAQVPHELYAVCARALAVNPDDRHATAAELRADLERCLPGTAESSARELGSVVAHAFADERERIRAAVERALRASPSAEGSDGGDDPWAAGSRATGSFSVARRSAPALLVPAATDGPPAAPGMTAPVPAARLEAVTVPSPAARARGKRTLVGLTGAALAAGLIGGWAVLRTRAIVGGEREHRAETVLPAVEVTALPSRSGSAGVPDEEPQRLPPAVPTPMPDPEPTPARKHPASQRRAAVEPHVRPSTSARPEPFDVALQPRPARKPERAIDVDNPYESP